MKKKKNNLAYVSLLMSAGGLLYFSPALYWAVHCILGLVCDTMRFMIWFRLTFVSFPRVGRAACSGARAQARTQARAWVRAQARAPARA